MIECRSLVAGQNYRGGGGDSAPVQPLKPNVNEPAVLAILVIAEQRHVVIPRLGPPNLSALVSCITSMATSIPSPMFTRSTRQRNFSAAGIDKERQDASHLSAG